MDVIRPTGRCFDDALDFLELQYKLMINKPVAEIRRRLKKYTVVHALCLAEGDVVYAHAWVEATGVVWQGGIIDGCRVYFSQSNEDFYKHRVIKEMTRYTLMAALEENDKSNHYGPWVPHYQQFCRSVAESVRPLGINSNCTVLEILPR